MWSLRASHTHTHRTKTQTQHTHTPCRITSYSFGGKKHNRTPLAHKHTSKERSAAMQTYVDPLSVCVACVYVCTFLNLCVSVCMRLFGCVWSPFLSLSFSIQQRFKTCYVNQRIIDEDLGWEQEMTWDVMWSTAEHMYRKLHGVLPVHDLLHKATQERMRAK